MNNKLCVLKSFIAAISLAVMLGSCGKDNVSYENISSSQQPEGQGMFLSQKNSGEKQDSGYAEGELESLDGTGRNLFEDSNSDEYKATYGRSTAPLLPVYFGFDSISIDVDQFDTLNESATYLMENRSTDLVIEGNCDERGTTDYNIALGELRAQNVKKYLLNYGIAEDRISTISFGAERPLYPESNETAWAANRRADLILP